MLDNNLKTHVQNMDNISKESIRNILRSGAESLRIKAQGARDYAEHVRQMEVVEEIASTPERELDESLTELDEAKFKAVLLVDSMVVNLLIRQLATEEGFGNSVAESTDELVKAKEMVKLIKEGDKETISNVIEELVSMQKYSHDINGKIFSFLGKEKFHAINQKAKDIATTYSSEIYA